ncbi:hypothetical protein K7X08_009455 [Anisodus acutangulus]|uniref:Uncharacterized protein n=1 Tax=Anisodus acutangulus TaxID=402998 RepID=A0A9Q1RTI4_9SOLA|nr:hypothetical protein K7X08_009455 [Anisodus acutangulus]
MLEGLQRHQSASDVLQSVKSYFCNIGASSKLDSASFNVDVTLSGLPADTRDTSGERIIAPERDPPIRGIFFYIPAITGNSEK